LPSLAGQEHLLVIASVSEAIQGPQKDLDRVVSFATGDRAFLQGGNFSSQDRANRIEPLQQTRFYAQMPSASSPASSIGSVVALGREPTKPEWPAETSTFGAHSGLTSSILAIRKSANGRLFD
jgi:hypothetical protein